MRLLTDHKLNGLNDALTITVLDEPGPGGACHVYEIDHAGDSHEKTPINTEIRFQNGPINEAGVNGISGEALVAIVIDRLRGFQYGPTQLPTARGEFACRENAIALTHMEEALMWLQKRTRDRIARGVEGTMVK